MSTEPTGATAAIDAPVEAEPTPTVVPGPSSTAASASTALPVAELADLPPERQPLVAPRQRKVRRGRRVKRVIRRIELWSVLKLALVFYTCMYAVVMGALVVVWGFAYKAGLVDNFESFANDVGFEHWQFYGEHMFRQAAVIGGVLVVALTILTVLAAALLNVISELTGGIRVVVIEEEIAFVPLAADGVGGAAAGADEGAAAPTTGRKRRRGGSA